MMEQIAYTDIRKYKYRLKESCTFETPIRPTRRIASPGDYVVLDTDGSLSFKEGYFWDGCSGPTIDSKKSQRASLEHDGFYQLMRLGLLPFSKRDQVDDQFRDRLLEDGFWEFRANYYHWGVSKFAAKYARPGTEKPLKVKYAP